MWHSRPRLCALGKAPAPHPVRARLVKRAEECGWSSARAHVLGEADELVDGRSAFERGVGYREVGGVPAGGVAAGDAHGAGRFCGAVFVRRLEAVLGRMLSPRKRGPKGASEEEGEGQ